MVKKDHFKVDIKKLDEKIAYFRRIWVKKYFL